MDGGVAVVGGGPVGLVTGLLLHGHGVVVRVYERDPQPSPLPRAVHLDDEALRVLADVGVGEAVSADARPISGMSLVDARLRPFLTLERDPGPGPLGFPASVLLHQPRLEECLRAAADERGLLVTGREVADLAQGPDGVTLRLDGGRRSETRSVAYVVGCDGARGSVRGLAGIPDEQLGPRQRWLVMDLRVHPEPAHPARVLQVCDPRWPATSVPVGAGRHRFEFMVGDADEGEVIAAALARARHWLGDVDIGVERAVVYAFGARLARRFARGRVLLAGDAAHEMPPFLGQGLCSGLGDAASLAWRLGLAATGRADERVLQDYDAERRDRVRRAIALTQRVGRVVADRRSARARLRRATLTVADRVMRGRGGLAALERPPLRAGPFVDRSGRLEAAGRPLPRPRVRAAGRIEALDRLLGPGFAVIGVGVDPRLGLPVAQRRWWEELGTSFVAVDADPRDAAGTLLIHDPGGWLRSWAQAHRAAIVVARPDRIVLGAYPMPEPGRLSPVAELTRRLRRGGLRG